MPRVLALVSILCISMFTTGTMVAQILGHWQPPNPALRGFHDGCDDKPQPCWYGIIPGVTTLDELAHILNMKGYRRTGDGAGTLMYWQTGDLCSRIWLGLQQDIVTRLGMLACGDIYLGNMSLIFGDFYTVTQSGLTLLNGQVIIGLPAQTGSTCMVVTPYGRVAQIWLSDQAVAPDRERLAAWHGYLSFNHYRKLYGLDCSPLGTGSS
jgi:hypothetical protein